jgi:hypothetical protein
MRDFCWGNINFCKILHCIYIRWAINKTMNWNYKKCCLLFLSILIWMLAGKGWGEIALCCVFTFGLLVVKPRIRSHRNLVCNCEVNGLYVQRATEPVVTKGAMLTANSNDRQEFNRCDFESNKSNQKLVSCPLSLLDVPMITFWRLSSH